MDTQRLILFIIFSFSRLPVVGRVAEGARAVAPPRAAGRARGRASAAATAKDLPVPSAATAPGGAPRPRAELPAQGDAAPKGQTITIRTDLYTAEVDTAGGVDHDGRARCKHRDSRRHDEALPRRCSATPSARYVAQAGLLGEGMPNHRTLYEALPGPARARSRRGPRSN